MSWDISKFKGTGVAIVTPFNEDKTVDYNSLSKLVDFIIKNNVNYIVALGTTGEPATLNDDEKKKVVRTIVEANNKRVPIVLGIGGNNTQDVIDEIKEWNFDGIDAILSVCPYYNKPSQRGIIEHFKAIAASTNLPILIYNIPGRSGVNMAEETILELANNVKNIIGIKEASGIMSQMMGIIKNRPKDFLIISGDDLLTYPLMSLGGDGVISVIANIYPKEFSDMVKYAAQHNIKDSLALHYKLSDFINLLFAEGSPSGIKAALSQKGMMSNSVRLPLFPVSDKLFEQLKLEMQKIL